MKRITNKIFILTFILLSTQNGWAQHAHVLTSDIEFSCDQTENQMAIKCAYRFTQPEITKMISASLGATELPIQDIKTYPFEESSTSILFLVDSSKSNNPERLPQIKNQIIALAQQALPYQQIGLATFDSRLSILKSLGSDPEEIINVANDLVETEQPTELYRNVLDALELLKSSQADRKAIYLFSNGEYEDQAIYHTDVIKAAKESAIKIISIAYPVAENPIDTTKTLSNLSKDSGGMFVKATENDFELPESFMSDPYAVIDNGGVLTIDLTRVLSGDTSGVQLALLIFETTSKKITVKLPLELSSTNNSTIAQLKDSGTVSVKEDGKSGSSDLSTLEESTEAAKNITPANSHNQPTLEKNTVKINVEPDSFSDSPFIKYWPIIPVGLFVLGFLSFMLLRNKQTPEVVEQEDDGKPIAWLVSLDDESVYYEIVSSPWSVGRTRQNDLFLEHSSISRQHAKFKRDQHGNFTVTDLDSLNGVFVNNTKIPKSKIKDGDKIDIGDVRLKFVLDINGT
ncbi:MAG: FHA domain-containing protein [Gammaproteobacteria bacterium]